MVCGVGGGGLASGLGLWAAGRPGTRVVAVEAARSPAFSTALAAGAITEVEVGETLADGLAGNIEPGSVTFPLVRDHVAAVAGVEEPADRGRHPLPRAGARAGRRGRRGGAGAALLSGAVEPGEGTTVLIVSGRNIALDRLAAVLGRTSTGWVGRRDRRRAGPIPPLRELLLQRRNRRPRGPIPPPYPAAVDVQAASAIGADRIAAAGGDGSANAGCAMFR